MAIISTENELFVFDTGAGYTGQNYITADNANQLIGLTPDAISAIESVSALTGYGYGDMQSNKLEYNTSGYITGYDGSAFAGQGTIPEPIKYTYGTRAYDTFVPNDLQYNNKIEIRRWQERGDYGRGVVLGDTLMSHEEKMGTVVLGIKGGSYASWEAAGKPSLMDISDLQSRVNTLESGESSLNDRVTTLENGESALQSRVNTLESGESSLNDRVTTLEYGESDLEIRVNTLETVESTLQSRVNTLENGESALQSRINTLESLVNTLSGALSAQWSLVAGTGITITNDASNKKSTISLT